MCGDTQGTNIPLILLPGQVVLDAVRVYIAKSFSCSTMLYDMQNKKEILMIFVPRDTSILMSKCHGLSVYECERVESADGCTNNGSSKATTNVYGCTNEA